MYCVRSHTHISAVNCSDFNMLFFPILGKTQNPEEEVAICKKLVGQILKLYKL